MRVKDKLELTYSVQFPGQTNDVPYDMVATLTDSFLEVVTIVVSAKSAGVSCHWLHLGQPN